MLVRKVVKWILSALGALVAVLALLIAFLFQPDIPVEILKERYATGASQFVTIEDMVVHYRDEGPREDSIPLVLLHGTSSSLLTWDSCAREWSKQRRVVRMDLPGFGLTGPNAANDYSLEAYAHFLDSFMQYVGASQCHLAGNSLGGLIAVYYANTRPDKVQKVILLDPTGYPVQNAKGSLGFTLGRIPVVNHLLTIVTPRQVVRKSLEDVYGNKARVTDALVDQYHSMACREGNRKALLKRLSKETEYDTLMVSRVRQPVLVIWGEEDQLVPVANAWKFQRDLPDNSLVVLKGVGHVPMEEAPALVIPLVAGFLAKPE
jgi:pimeloyl-ACP methyl ester carboxylesterase